MASSTEALALAREIVELEARLEAKRAEFQQLFEAAEARPTDHLWRAEIDGVDPGEDRGGSLRSRILSVFERHPGKILGIPALGAEIPDVGIALVRSEVGRLSRTFKGLKRVGRGRYLLTHTARARMEASK